jgi:hypothetical protein
MQMVMLLDVKENINICAQILKKYLSEQDIKINFYERMDCSKYLKRNFSLLYR